MIFLIYKDDINSVKRVFVDPSDIGKSRSKERIELEKRTVIDEDNLYLPNFPKIVNHKQSFSTLDRTISLIVQPPISNVTFNLSKITSDHDFP